MERLWAARLEYKQLELLGSLLVPVPDPPLAWYSSTLPAAAPAPSPPWILSSVSRTSMCSIKRGLRFFPCLRSQLSLQMRPVYLMLLLTSQPRPPSPPPGLSSSPIFPTRPFLTSSSLLLSSTPVRSRQHGRATTCHGSSSLSPS